VVLVVNNVTLQADDLYIKKKVFYGPARLVEKELVCNRKGPICKDPTVEINSIRPIFLAVVRQYSKIVE
jgi:hypothetical protein